MDGSHLLERIMRLRRSKSNELSARTSYLICHLTLPCAHLRRSHWTGYYVEKVNVFSRCRTICEPKNINGGVLQNLTRDGCFPKKRVQDIKTTFLCGDSRHWMHLAFSKQTLKMSIITIQNHELT